MLIQRCVFELYVFFWGINAIQLKQPRIKVISNILQELEHNYIDRNYLQHVIIYSSLDENIVT